MTKKEFIRMHCEVGTTPFEHDMYYVYYVMGYQMRMVDEMKERDQQ